jgi:2-oxoglutarate dehydrogenase E2 component (dihydrolipoamide succinyltransferase)
MSEEYKITLPKLGESIVSATVVQWFKKEGDLVKLDEPLLEVSTDKVNSEIPSPVAGTLKKILADPDQELDVGELLAIVEKQSGSSSPVEQEAKKVETQEAPAEASQGNEFLSPAVLRIAGEKGISFPDLQKIKGTGASGRVTKQDVEAFVAKREEKAPCAPKKAPCPLEKGEERVKMTGMRKAVAENMVKSFYEAPHATLIHEIDVTRIIKKIKKEKEDFLKEHGAKLTVTSFVLAALAKTLKEYPLLNSSLEKDTIVLKKNVNIGVAVSIEQAGAQGLIVPVVKQCQTMSLPQLAKSVGDLSKKAREGRLSPDDVVDGTVTVTNFGMSGVSIGVPIIRYPEVAIIGIGAIKKQVQVVEDDILAICSMMHLSLTFDHRIIDGMYGCAFLSSLEKNLKEFVD